VSLRRTGVDMAVIPGVDMAVIPFDMLRVSSSRSSTDGRSRTSA
jgi:hypothetical protein